MIPSINQSQSTAIDEAKDRAIRFIQMDQDPTGRFVTCSSIFASTIILRCLGSISHFNVTKNIRKKGVYFLMNKRSKNWSWNYWLGVSKCPDDLDDTFSALSAITMYDEDLITGEALSYISNILISCETSAGGPYNTWLLPNSQKQNKDWLDIDIVVNSNIAYFLKLKGVKMPRLIDYTEKAIKEADVRGKYDSKYYDDLTILYFISRWYTGSMIGTIRAQVLKLKNSDGNWGNNLRNALAISILTSIDAPYEIFADNVKNLIETMTPFESFPFYIESVKSSQPSYAESPTLTAAICAEALSLFEQKYINKNQNTRTYIENDIHEKIITEVKSHIDQFPQNIKTEANKILKKIEKDRQITTMSYSFSKNCSGMESIASELGTANVYGWLAYTIYDDILDLENERTNLLPVANICFMKALEIYEKVNKGNVRLLSKNLILKMERANAWEKEFCNIASIGSLRPSNIPIYESYDILAEKSMPHALGPISLFLLREKDPTVLINFFRHYLIARQLNDDAHDWLEDLNRGFVNSVGSLLLLEYFSKYPDRSAVDVNDEQSKELSYIFHNKILDSISTNIEKEISKARQILKTIKPIWNKSYLEEMLKPLEKSALKAISERNSVTEFIAAFSSSDVSSGNSRPDL